MNRSAVNGTLRLWRKFHDARHPLVITHAYNLPILRSLELHPRVVGQTLAPGATAPIMPPRNPPNRLRRIKPDQVMCKVLECDRTARFILYDYPDGPKPAVDA